MKKVIFIVVPILLALAVVTSPAFAKNPDAPRQGPLWDAIASLQQQIETGLATLAGQVSEGLALLQGQIDAVQAYLGNFTETDPTVSEIVKDGVDWFELSGIPADFADGDVSWSELSGIPSGFADGTDDCGWLADRFREVHLSLTVTLSALEGYGDYYLYHADCLNPVIAAGARVLYWWEGLQQFLNPSNWRVSTYMWYNDVYWYFYIKNPFAFEKTFTIDFYFTGVRPLGCEPTYPG